MPKNQHTILTVWMSTPPSPLVRVPFRLPNLLSIPIYLFLVSYTYLSTTYYLPVLGSIFRGAFEENSYNKN
jgi:hypothetical protein